MNGLMMFGKCGQTASPNLCLNEATCKKNAVQKSLRIKWDPAKKTCNLSTFPKHH